jgi:cytosine/uracil/thiamine/allantoin permease
MYGSKNTALFSACVAFVLVKGNVQAQLLKKGQTNYCSYSLINYNRTQGVIIGAMVSKYYKLKIVEFAAFDLYVVKSQQIAPKPVSEFS